MARYGALPLLLFLIALPTCLSAQNSAVWQDPSPHKVQFVTVDKDVKLEVLDWGGTGRPVVLLAGLGETAHTFDEFAPKLTSDYHVYGITRRGFGASSAPDTGYSADQLGDDVLAVCKALNLDRPVLVGHSVAGEELSSIGSRYPETVSGLIYLEAAYSYAFYDEARGDLTIDSNILQRKLGQLHPENGRPDTKDIRDTLQELQRVEKDLESSFDNMTPTIEGAANPRPSTTDRASFAAFRAWQLRTNGIAAPESELRQSRQVNADGSVGAQRSNPRVAQAVIAGGQRYTKLGTPVLAIYALPHDPGPSDRADPIVRAYVEAFDSRIVGPQAKALEMGVPSARVVRLPNAQHAIFRSNEADVLREMRAFIATLH